MEQIENVRMQFLQECQRRVQNPLQVTFIESLLLKEIKVDAVVFETCSLFKKDLLEAHFIEIMQNAMEAVLGHPIKICIAINDAEASEEDKREIQMRRLSQKVRYTLENYQTDKNYDAAYLAAVTAAEQPGSSLNPLLLFGRSNVHRMHLLFAIEDRIRELYPEKAVAAMRCETICAYLHHSSEIPPVSSASSNGDMDVLIIMDIDVIQGREFAQQQLLSILEKLLRDNKQIVFFAQTPPQEMTLGYEPFKRWMDLCHTEQIKTPDKEISPEAYNLRLLGLKSLDEV